MTALVIVFIFAQSILPQSVSAEESGWIMNRIVNPFFEFLGFQPPSHQTVRKMAHIFEFAVLAVLLVFCWNGKALQTVGTGFLIAFLDESLQILTARGARIQDVWIDLCGILTGTLLGYLLRRLMQRRQYSSHPTNHS